MANNKSFKIKNGLSATRYLQSSGADGAGSVGYNLADASYDSISFSVATQETGPHSIRLKSDGTKVYVLGKQTADAVYQYTLSTAYDLSTISYDSVSFSVATQGTNPNSIEFSPDGTKMYMLDVGNDTVFQYTLSTAWDISTASYASKSFSVTSQESSPHDLAFNSDGTKLFIVGLSSDKVHQYSLSTAYDISTASYDSVEFSVASQTTLPVAMHFNGDGTRLFVSGVSGNASIYQYTLSTAYDISTASYDSVSLDVSSQDSEPYGFTFDSIGSKLFLMGQSSDTIYQYSGMITYTQTLDLSTGTFFSFTPSGPTEVSFTNPPASGVAMAFTLAIPRTTHTITFPSSVKWEGGTAPTLSIGKTTYSTFVTVDGGTTYYAKAVRVY